MHRIARLDEETYRKLHKISGGLQSQLGRRVSLSDALAFLIAQREGRTRVFWRAIREKKLSGALGRGPKRKTSKKPLVVRIPMNSRPEII